MFLEYNCKQYVSIEVKKQKEKLDWTACYVLEDFWKIFESQIFYF